MHNCIWFLTICATFVLMKRKIFLFKSLFPASDCYRSSWFHHVTFISTDTSFRVKVYKFYSWNCTSISGNKLIKINVVFQHYYLFAKLSQSNTGCVDNSEWVKRMQQSIMHFQYYKVFGFIMALYIYMPWDLENISIRLCLIDIKLINIFNEYLQIMTDHDLFIM